MAFTFTEFFKEATENIEYVCCIEKTLRIPQKKYEFRDLGDEGIILSKHIIFMDKNGEETIYINNAKRFLTKEDAMIESEGEWSVMKFKDAYRKNKEYQSRYSG